jgi:hypothetical protein
MRTVNIQVRYTDEAAQALAPTCEPGQRLVMDDAYLAFMAPLLLKRMGMSGASFATIHGKTVRVNILKKDDCTFLIELA